MDALTHPHQFPGKLIIVEGIDGSGKSTQLQLAKRYLEAKGFKTAGFCGLADYKGARAFPAKKS